MLNVSKFGKLLLSAYLMDKIKKESSSKQNSGLLKKYAELALGAYILKKLKSAKSEDNEIVVETEEIETSEIEGGSKVKGRKHVVTGAVAGASGIAIGAVGALAGIAILYVAKKQMDKRHKSKIAVQ
ncbi:MAG: hypothetical protein ACPK85_07250 [Methanosarcina sp.]